MMNSDVDFLQRPSTNQPPSDDEIPRIRSFRQDCQARIDSVNQQIEQLVEQRKLLEEDLKRYDSLLAPVKRVPEDVLLTIFQHTSAICTGVEDFRSWHWRKTPPSVIPSQICQEWRRLALLTPVLWATVAVMPPDYPLRTMLSSEPPHVVEIAARQWELRMKQLFQILSLWIERSKQDPLSVILRFNVFRRQGGQGQAISETSSVQVLYLELVSLVCRVAPRWKSLYLNINPNNTTILDMLTALKSDDVPLLEAISFRTDAVSGAWNPVFAPPGLFMGKRLRSFAILQLDESWSRLSINWAAVKELQLGVESRWTGEEGELYSNIERNFGPYSIRSLLHMCPNLERWELSVQSSNRDDSRWPALPASVNQDPREHVRHSRLRTLVFHGSQPSEALTSSLELPSLQQLHFLGELVAHTDPGGRATLSRRFLRFVDHHGSQVTDLRFSHLLLGDVASITQCFASFPNLLSLHLDGGVPSFDESTKDVVTSLSNAAVAILVALTPETGEGRSPVAEVPLCPTLKRFVYQPTIRCFTETQVLEFILGRSRTTGPLNSARIEEVDVRFAIPQEMDIPSELKSRGVDVDHLTLRIRYPKPRDAQSRQVVVLQD